MYLPVGRGDKVLENGSLLFGEMSADVPANKCPLKGHQVIKMRKVFEGLSCAARKKNIFYHPTGSLFFF